MPGQWSIRSLVRNTKSRRLASQLEQSTSSGQVLPGCDDRRAFDAFLKLHLCSESENYGALPSSPHVLVVLDYRL
jgi:hypothetical protein